MSGAQTLLTAASMPPKGKMMTGIRCRDNGQRKKAYREAYYKQTIKPKP